MLLRLILGAGEELGFDLDRGAGDVGRLHRRRRSRFAGAVMNYTRSGGKFSDLTDMDKMRGAFKGSGGRGSRTATATATAAARTVGVRARRRSAPSARRPRSD